MTQHLISVDHKCRSSSFCSSSLLPQVTSNDKTPTVISSALEKHNQDPKHVSRYELIQLLPEGKGEIRTNALPTSVLLLWFLFCPVVKTLNMLPKLASGGQHTSQRLTGFWVSSVFPCSSHICFGFTTVSSTILKYLN